MPPVCSYTLASNASPTDNPITWWLACQCGPCAGDGLEGEELKEAWQQVPMRPLSR